MYDGPQTSPHGPTHEITCAVTACPLCPGTAVVTRMGTAQPNRLERGKLAVPPPN